MPVIINEIAKASQLLSRGELVAIPTETVYGLAADATNPVAVKKVFDLKGRPYTHPLILHVGPNVNLHDWILSLSDAAKRLMDAFWPGPLTLVLPLREGSVAAAVTGGQPTIAIRMPAHPVAMGLLAHIDRPLVAPSANPFKKVSPTTAQHVADSFPNTDLTILDGGRCVVGIESTIVLATEPNEVSLLRPGMISAEEIETVVGMPLQRTVKSIRAPGAMAEHYQPQKPLFYFETLAQLEAYCANHPTPYTLCFTERFAQGAAVRMALEPKVAAYELYYQLRQADETPCEAIAIELPPNTDSWLPIRERIIKAGKPLL